jgi:apolipoprotein N-acyltransferase
MNTITPKIVTNKKEITNIKKKQALILCLGLALLSGILLGLGFPPYTSAPLLAFAFIPLFVVNELACKNQLSYSISFLIYWFTCIVWNMIVTFWLYNTVIIPVILLHLINSLFFAIILTLFRLIYQKISKNIGFLALVLLWIGFEFVHHKWELAYPFMTLGNGLASFVEVIQWYEYTGVLGGSCWILLLNILAYKVIELVFLTEKEQTNKKTIYKFISIWLLIFSIPSLFSYILFYTYIEQGNKTSVLVIHPNTDCYTEKYNQNSEILTKQYVEQIKQVIKPSTNFVILPETAITDAGFYGNMEANKSLQICKDFLKQYPQTKIITGAIAYQYADKLQATKEPNLNYTKEYDYWYYAYNIALQIDSSKYTSLHCKQHLVPFEERIPYPKFFGILKNVVAKLGFWHFETNIPYQNTFRNATGNFVPLVCFESIFGESAAKAVNDGGEALVVMLNEGWYNNQTGASQFMHYASLRAIENRRAVVRSSNYGYSCFIDQKGTITNAINDRKPATLTQDIYLNTTKTFYTKYGDWIGRWACFGLVGLCFYFLYRILFT